MLRLSLNFRKRSYKQNQGQMNTNKYDYPEKPFFPAREVYELTCGTVSMAYLFKLALSESKRVLTVFYVHLMIEVLKSISRHLKASIILNVQRLISQIATVFKGSITALKYISLVYQLATVS